ncbi:hypothetical protein PR202_gb25681 [Eleusine coracana subsp. coracana]|uniref:Uncharacterized protein n=1 Tax=Eleusine coracana subsp. coracana TaxID=191504 RepID=A0AAV5FPV4_ELECO|nr:hypothetical protein PR202_gb25681 [Eleusine coracana subsp. coracana]
MDDDAVAGPDRRRQQPPGFFAFLGHGFAVPFRNRGLFLPLLALTAGLAAALLLGNALAVQPLAASVLADADAISRADPSSAVYRALLAQLQCHLTRLLLATGACLLAAALAGSAIKIATVFAAVAAFSSSSPHSTTTTFSSAMGKAKDNVWGPVITIAFSFVIEIACAVAILAMALFAIVLIDYSLLLLFLDALLVLLASLALVYLAVVCAVAVVVSAAEPGGARGAGAVARAWRLMRGKGAQAAAYVIATCALGAAVSPVYTLATRWWTRNEIIGAAAGVAYVLLLGAVEVVSVVAVTAYYFECREAKEEEEEIMAAHHRYIKLPSGDEAANI